MSCEALTEFLKQFDGLDPEKHYVSLDSGDVGIMLSTFLYSVGCIKALVCGEGEVDSPCRRIEHFLNFLWMLRWRNGVLKVFLFDRVPVEELGIELRKVSYLSTAPQIPTRIVRLDKIPEIASELYQIYREVCGRSKRVKQLVEDILGEEPGESSSGESSKRRRRKRRKSEEGEEVASDSFEVVSGDRYEVVNDVVEVIK